MGLFDFLSGRLRRRKRLLASPFPEEWERHLEDVAFFETLEPEEQAKLKDDLRVVLHEKHWEGCGGLEVTDYMRVVVSAQAALLLLNLERHDYYRHTHTILIYPSGFLIPPDEPHGQRGISAGGVAMYRGPVAVAWDESLAGAQNRHDGRNVVLHEFAHKLDMLDHLVDGTPPIRNRAQFAEWVNVMTNHFARLTKAKRTGVRTILDKYGATNAGEFFAVATEAFFEKPRQLKKKHTDLYGVLSAYYRQDPAERGR